MKKLTMIIILALLLLLPSLLFGQFRQIVGITSDGDTITITLPTVFEQWAIFETGIQVTVFASQSVVAYDTNLDSTILDPSSLYYILGVDGTDKYFYADTTGKGFFAQNLTIGSDPLNYDGSFIWIDADGGTGNATISSDGLTFSGFSGGVDVDGVFTAETVTSDADIISGDDIGISVGGTISTSPGSISNRPNILFANDLLTLRTPTGASENVFLEVQAYAAGVDGEIHIGSVASHTVFDSLGVFHSPGDNTRILQNGDIDITDRSSLAGESLADDADFSQATWSFTGEVTDVGTYAIYTYAASGNGTITQTDGGDMAIDGVANRWYQFDYMVSSSTVADEVVTITSQFALAAVTLSVGSNGAFTEFFKSAAVPGDFVIDITGATSGAFTIEFVSLKQVIGGDLTVSGDITGYGDVDVFGNIVLASGRFIGNGISGNTERIQFGTGGSLKFTASAFDFTDWGVANSFRITMTGDRVNFTQATDGYSFDQHVIRSVTAGITATNPGVQGDSPLTGDINEVSVVGAGSDAVTLPTAVVGLEIFIINNGANVLEIWPASGDDLGAGVDTATTLASDANITFVTYDDTNWEVK